MSMNLVPINSCVLVELTETSQFIDIPDQKFATQATGIVRSVAADSKEFAYLTNKVVYFEEYRDSAKVEIDDNKFAFIKIEEIRGYDNE